MTDIKIYTENIEDEALNQIRQLVSLPAFENCKIRIMPDVHAGAGCVIGFTANLGDKVIPNIVGVDIGCGMLTIRLGKNNLDLSALDAAIRKCIPFGRNVHESRHSAFDLQELYCYRDLKDTRRLVRSIGTLGGGNHFIEIDQDEEDCKYLVIHTGSRNLGKQVAEYYQNLAVDLMQGKDKLFKAQEQMISEYKAQGRKKELQSALKELRKSFKAADLLIPRDLCYLTGEYREKYLHDMEICQRFAVENRKTIAELLIDEMKLMELDRFETIHNYIETETNMVRKGAISAKKGEMVLIPINMRDGCILGIGKGNEDWNCSAPHGAGRLMSRTMARQTVSLKDYADSMKGIYTTTVDETTLDECPMAYKPIEEIMENIRGTVDIIRVIRPIYNFKASE